MMQCPVCRTTYTDTTLKYCLSDRTELVPVEQETVVRSASANPLRVDIQRPAATVAVEQGDPAATRRFPIVKVVLGLAILGIIAIGTAGIIFAFIYLNSGEVSLEQKHATPTPIAKASVDPDKQKLDDQIANLQRQLDEQKNSNRGPLVPAFPTPAPTDRPGGVTARVNSPGDGFLAMRSEPSADYGDRVAKIPHGAVVNIENCERTEIRIGNRSGRWCLVRWGNNVGWVFDAWLDY